MSSSYRRDRQQSEATMRWLYVIIIIAFVAAIIIFAVQNFQVVNMSFLGFNLRAPLALVAAILYVLGAITGGSLFALLRKSIRESKLTGIR
jgi:lipopolysaccharide assembly protein A